MALRSLTAALCVGLAAGSSMHLAKLCRGHTCTDAVYPILDYAAAESKCVCRAHPCWEDNGLVHSCDAEKYPFLSFSYDENKKLKCGCSATPSYASTYITKDLCAGHLCEEEAFPLLDYSEEEGKCFCRAHPCHDLEGIKHECSDAKFPILRCREDETAPGSGKAKPVCECAAKFEAPSGTGEL
eukprot:CAMPEP_0203965128 /NCGR_PEP_ID=MMETSP0359-20131031/94699_1 /ASSEMBLY_ACC=CAM_ASM_000338 /TAXON_ID=268821 /ORGANISM="Scrippsiella Hangoei, Strain SHTV-5" /LENGTH=183 /DNA_ID=CAMNT_0050901877 /DNA_START=75 /DNA_END=626 /DNA_ORIENTATION=-